MTIIQKLISKVFAEVVREGPEGYFPADSATVC